MHLKSRLVLSSIATHRKNDSQEHAVIAMHGTDLCHVSPVVVAAGLYIAPEVGLRR